MLLMGIFIIAAPFCTSFVAFCVIIAVQGASTGLYAVGEMFSAKKTRSSAQGNCSAKSLAGNAVMSSILPCPPCLQPRGSRWGEGEGVVGGGGGGGRGEVGGGGWGWGTFHPPCHVLHHHIMLRPKGTSHNNHIQGKDGSGGSRSGDPAESNLRTCFVFVKCSFETGHHRGYVNFGPKVEVFST